MSTELNSQLQLVKPLEKEEELKPILHNFERDLAEYIPTPQENQQIVKLQEDLKCFHAITKALQDEKYTPFGLMTRFPAIRTRQKICLKMRTLFTALLLKLVL